MAYGPNFPDLFRRRRRLCRQDLRGAKPGDIPSSSQRRPPEECEPPLSKRHVRVSSPDLSR
jgi:hypothetical protein